MESKETIKTIETINIAMAEVEWNYPMDYVVAFEEAIKALEKQLPKKAIIIDDEMGFFECPACGGVIGYMDDPKSHKYCLMCGQALDWGDDNDE